MYFVAAHLLTLLHLTSHKVVPETASPNRPAYLHMYIITAITDKQPCKVLNILQCGSMGAGALKQAAACN